MQKYLETTGYPLDDSLLIVIKQILDRYLFLTYNICKMCDFL